MGEQNKTLISDKDLSVSVAGYKDVSSAFYQSAQNSRMKPPVFPSGVAEFHRFPNKRLKPKNLAQWPFPLNLLHFWEFYISLSLIF